MIKDKLLDWNARVGAMTLRERLFIFAALAVAILAILQTLLVDGLQVRQSTASARVQAAEAALLQIGQRRMLLTGAGMKDLDQVAREQLAGHERRLAALNAELEMHERSLIPPARMVQVLKDVVKDSGGVKVVGIKTLSPQPVALGGAAEGAPPGFYRHGFEMKVKGRYSDLVVYLSRLEDLSWRLNWIEAKLDAAARPELSLTLIIHTLSLEEAWLRV